MYRDEPKVKYCFRYEDLDGKVTEVSHDVDDSCTWAETVETFLSFVEIIYGYPVKKDVLYDIDLYENTKILNDRLVCTNWKRKKKNKKDVEEQIQCITASPSRSNSAPFIFPKHSHTGET